MLQQTALLNRIRSIYSSDLENEGYLDDILVEDRQKTRDAVEETSPPRRMGDSNDRSPVRFRFEYGLHALTVTHNYTPSLSTHRYSIADDSTALTSYRLLHGTTCWYLTGSSYTKLSTSSYRACFLASESGVNAVTSTLSVYKPANTRRSKPSLVENNRNKRSIVSINLYFRDPVLPCSKHIAPHLLRQGSSLLSSLLFTDYRHIDLLNTISSAYL